MSVILTAGKNPLKAKTKPKKSKKKKGSSNFVPPISSPKTVVWYWLIDEVAVTVMYTKENNEVWCNGSILPTKMCFSPHGNKGIAIEFVIVMGNSHHPAAIIKNGIDGTGMMTHELFVDGYMIHDHIGQQPEDSSTLITMGEFYDQPPSYESIAGQL